MYCTVGGEEIYIFINKKTASILDLWETYWISNRKDPSNEFLDPKLHGNLKLHKHLTKI